MTPGPAGPVRTIYEVMTGPANNEWGAPAPVPAPAPPSGDYEPIHPGSGRGSGANG